jgi:hypothetical protein
MTRVRGEQRRRARPRYCFDQRDFLRAGHRKVDISMAPLPAPNADDADPQARSTPTGLHGQRRAPAHHRVRPGLGDENDSANALSGLL